MRLIVKLIFFVAFIASIIWAVKKPDYDSIIAAIAALGALVAAFVAEKKPEAQNSMSQKVAKGGKGIQAGGNITITKK